MALGKDQECVQEEGKEEDEAQKDIQKWEQCRL